MKTNNIQIKNRKAYFDYAIVDTYISGIILTGPEIKSIRAGKASLVDAYCYIHNNELWLKNSYVAPYENVGYVQQEERRERKLLLTKKEIKYLAKEVQTPGNTIIPLKMFINDRGLCKLEIGLCKGKKDYDKRESIKERDIKKELDKTLKSYNYNTCSK